MRRDGSDVRTLRECSTPVSWAPDSLRLACTTYSEGIAVADTARGMLKQLSPSGDNPRWSPDGRSIAYTDGTLRIADVATGRLLRLGRRVVYVQPSWSPDSRRIAYAARVGDGDGLFTIGADGSGERLVVKNVEGSHGIEWSPLGSRIAFSRYSRRPLVESVYTVRPDGTGLRRVSRSAGGESSRQPSWSRDGTLLLYERERYDGADDSDVFVTAAGSGPGRPLTRPFPAGGTNYGAQWLLGPPLPATPPKRPRTLTLPAARTLAFAGPLGQVASDGARAAVGPGGCTIVVWAPLIRRMVRMRPMCDESGIGEVVLSGSRVAWTGSSHGNSEDFTELRAARVGSGRGRLVSAGSEFSGDGGSSGVSISALLGGGGTIAFTFSRFAPAERRSVWLVLPRRGSRCPAGADWTRRVARTCRRLAGGNGAVTAAVDSGRVAVVAGGDVRLLATSGRVLRTLRLRPPVDAVRLDGRTLAVQQGARVTLYDTRNGAKMRTRALAADEGEPRLLDVHAGLLLYATGGAIHVLRTANGDDRALLFPRAAPPLDAQLTARGLFAAWNRMYDRHPGRLSFVPLRTLGPSLASLFARSPPR
jgi:WD40 repeat protein